MVLSKFFRLNNMHNLLIINALYIIQVLIVFAGLGVFITTKRQFWLNLIPGFIVFTFLMGLFKHLRDQYLDLK